MPQVCQKCAKSMVKVWHKYARSMPEVCNMCGESMENICNKYENHVIWANPHDHFICVRICCIFPVTYIYIYIYIYVWLNSDLWSTGTHVSCNECVETPPKSEVWEEKKIRIFPGPGQYQRLWAFPSLW